MHRVVYFIVRSEGRDEAVETAQERFEDELKARTDTTYDYCRPMESGHSVAGSDRWSGFADEPVAAPLTDDQAIGWLRDGMDHTERHYAEDLFAMIQAMYECLENSVETAPDALDEIVAFVRENREEMVWSEGGESIHEEWPRTVKALYEADGSMHRYYAGEMQERSPQRAHIMDCYSYPTLTIADHKIYLENVEELINDQPDDAWVVPLDTHF